MTEKTKFKHVALQYSERKQAEIFFTKILELPLKKTFTVSKELSNAIFGINEEVIVDVYGNKQTCFEVFITNLKIEHNYNHTCIKIHDKEEFIKKCNKYGIKQIFVKKGFISLYL